MADATLKQIREYLGMEPAEFRMEWTKLSDQDKADFKKGIGDGSLTY